MIVLMSLWRNDENRQLQDRVAHLLTKRSFLDVRWLWVVGDSTDGTENFLRDVASLNPAITVLRHDSGMPDSNDVVDRRRRSSWTASRMFEAIPTDDDYVCLHEVGSFGSCWVAPADLVRGRQLDERAIVGLCQRWRMEGVRMWADPRTIVEQPTSLWVCS